MLFKKANYYQMKIIMRTIFKYLKGNHYAFEGVVQRFGTKAKTDGIAKDTFMVKNIRLANKQTVICDHIWLYLKKDLNTVKLGDIIVFEAHITKYEKGYKGVKLESFRPVEEDYHLYKIKNLKIVGHTFSHSLKAANTDFNISLSLPKTNKLPKDDWSNFFVDKIDTDQKIKTSDMIVPIKSIILNNLHKDRSLQYIERRILDFKRWVKSYNNGYLI